MTTNTQPQELSPGNVKSATAGMKSGDLWQVPYEDLHILPGFNVREEDDAYLAHVEDIKRSIVANGYMRDKPLSGYVAVINGKDVVVVTDGHTRHKAVGLAIAEGAEIKTLPVVTKPKGTSMEDLTVALVTSNSGRPLTPFEKGKVAKRLVDFGWETTAIAEKFGVTSEYIDELLSLQSAPKVVRDMVRSGQVSATLAISTIKKRGAEASKVLKEAVDTAKAKGKKKASAKHVAPDWKAECKKSGVKLFDAIKSVQEDENYKLLTKATRDFIKEVLSALPPEPEDRHQVKAGK